VGDRVRSVRGLSHGYASGTVIEHNEVTDMPYLGISVGWGWTLDDTVLRNNIIQYNHIYNVMNFLEDGGAIYTLSKQPGTRISQNYIHSIYRSSNPSLGAPVVGIYLDSGSSEITVSNNVISDVLSVYCGRDDIPRCVGGLFMQIYDSVAAGNTIINWDSSVFGNAGQNTFLYDGSYSPSDVIANAGIEPAYQDILKGILQRQRKTHRRFPEKSGRAGRGAGRGRSHGWGLDHGSASGSRGRVGRGHSDSCVIFGSRRPQERGRGSVSDFDVA
jgi:hypothetical protein